MFSTNRPLLFAVLAVVASFMVALWVSQNRLNDVESNVYEVAANAEPSVIHLEEARTELERTGVYVGEYVETAHLATGLAARARASAAWARAQESLAAYERLPFFPGEEDLFHPVRALLGPAHESVLAILASAQAGDYQAASAALINDLDPRLDELTSELQLVVDYDTAHAVTVLKAIARSRKRSWTAALVGATLSMILSAGAIVIATYALWRAASSRKLLDEELGGRLSAEEQVRRRDRFLGLAGHELRTPLTALQLGLEALWRGKEQSRLEAIVMRQVTRLSVLVEELMMVAKLDLGSVPVKTEQVDLTALVRERIQRQGGAIERSGSLVQFHGDAPVPGRGDPVALARVVDKLLSNAIRFGEGRPIDIAVTEGATTASIVVHDRGIGIPPDRIAAMFDRFERGVSERNYPGLGIGLYIARSLVKAMGGSILVTSSASDGTAFTVELPLAVAPVDSPAS